MAQQTAVEWLEEKLAEKLKLIILNKNYILMEHLFQVAKQMEKEQIIKAYIDGSYTGCGCYDYMNGNDGLEYYNETYKP